MKLLTMARDLQRRKARERLHRFVAEGVRAVEVLLDSGLTVHGLLVSREFGLDERGARLLERAGTADVPVREVSDDDLTDAADTDTPQGVLAIADIPDWSLTSGPLASPAPRARYLVLDALQDPGNVGTIVRTAAAMGVTATFAMPGTVDLWNAKVVRSAMGALFMHPVLPVTLDELAAFLRVHDIACWAADTKGIPLESIVAASMPARVALIVSNEGAGLSSPLEAMASARIAIRMAPGVESLNVAVATGILLHALHTVEPFTEPFAEPFAP